MNDDARDPSASRGSEAHPLAKSLRDMSDTLNACGNDFSDTLLDAAGELDRRRWIPVAERLPEPWVVVIVSTDDDDEADVGCVDALKQWLNPHTGDMAVSSVTHWMPLPALPTDGW